jgi:hypothetical protein
MQYHTNSFQYMYYIRHTYICKTKPSFSWHVEPCFASIFFIYFAGTMKISEVEGLTSGRLFSLNKTITHIFFSWHFLQHFKLKRLLEMSKIIRSKDLKMLPKYFKLERLLEMLKIIISKDASEIFQTRTVAGNVENHKI